MSGTTLPNSSVLSAIQRLKDATAMLPESTPEGSMDGVVWQSFSTRPQDVKGPLFTTINEALSECFLSNASLGLARVLKGTFGMDVVIRSLEECARYPTMSSSDLYILELKIGQLTDLVHHRVKSLPSGNKPPATRKRKRTRKASKPAKRISKHANTITNGNETTSDSEYEPEDASEHTDLNSPDGDDDNVNKVETATPPINTSRPQSPINANTGQAGTEVHGRQGKRPGPKDITRQWALANWKEPTATWNPNTKQPCWLFQCKYCDAIRRFERSQDCFEFSHEQKPLNSANLANRLKIRCRGIPSEQRFDAFLARSRRRSEALTPAQQSIGEIFRSSTAAPAASSSLSQVSFRSALIQGVIRDNYPLTFGEGKGMQMIFSLLNPSIELPCHQTMRQDLAQLFGILTMRMRQLLQSQSSRFSISSDAWTSKTFTYCISGVIVTFIDKNWNLQELLLDVIHIDADHTGKGMGQRLFWSLDRMGAAEKIIASMTDNASNNLTMNEALSGRIRDKFELTLNVKNMSVTCLCHALHLICGAILERVRAVDPPESDEVYAAFKSSDDKKTFEENAEIEDYEETHYNNHDWDGLDAGLSDSEAVENGSRNAVGSGSTESTENPLNPVQKVHAIAVHSTGSPLRRKKMRNIAVSLGLDPLAVVKGTRIRWNSVLAEIRRALRLKAAFNQYVSTLDEGNLTEKHRRNARALKRQWSINDEEWDALEELVAILEPFEAATNDFSRRGRTALHSVLPTYAFLRAKLEEARSRLNVLRGPRNDVFGMLDALAAGEEKLDKYFKQAQQSDLTLIATILHPGMRLSLFEDTNRLGGLGLGTRGRTLLEYLYEIYQLETNESPHLNPQPAAPISTSKGFIDSLIDLSHNSYGDELAEELLEYFAGKYRYVGGEILAWWKEHEIHFPILSRIARDFLAVPATSVSVERLFSRCKHVMADHRNMSVQTAREIVACQQWLSAGLGIDLPDFVLSS